MKLIKFTEFLNENENYSNSWKDLGPNWLFDYVMSQPESFEGIRMFKKKPGTSIMGKIPYIIIPHHTGA